MEDLLRELRGGKLIEFPAGPPIRCPPFGSPPAEWCAFAKLRPFFNFKTRLKGSLECHCNWVEFCNAASPTGGRIFDFGCGISVVVVEMMARGEPVKRGAFLSLCAGRRLPSVRIAKELREVMPHGAQSRAYARRHVQNYSRRRCGWQGAQNENAKFFSANAVVNHSAPFLRTVFRPSSLLIFSGRLRSRREATPK